MASPVNPRVSVVIPTYNQAHYLRETLVSVRAQTVPEWEAIVVNNFSEDDTLETVAGFNDERISVVNFRNEGIIAASRNQGVGRARAEWVAFLDSDDWWAPEKLERCLAAVTDDTAVLGHDMVMIKDGRQVSTHRSGPAARAGVVQAITGQWLGNEVEPGAGVGQLQPKLIVFGRAVFRVLRKSADGIEPAFSDQGGRWSHARSLE